MEAFVRISFTATSAHSTKQNVIEFVFNNVMGIEIKLQLQ